MGWRLISESNYLFVFVHFLPFLVWNFINFILYLWIVDGLQHRANISFSLELLSSHLCLMLQRRHVTQKLIYFGTIVLAVVFAAAGLIQENLFVLLVLIEKARVIYWKIWSVFIDYFLDLVGVELRSFLFEMKRDGLSFLKIDSHELLLVWATSRAWNDTIRTRATRSNFRRTLRWIRAFILIGVGDHYNSIIIKMPPFFLKFEFTLLLRGLATIF